MTDPMKKAWEIIKTNFYFDPDNPEGGRFDRTTGEVHINLASKDAKRSINMSEDEYIENLSDTLIEEYTHSAIDDEITSAFEEYLDYEFRNNTEKSPEELAAYGHTMHEIGANAARGYSKLATWLTILGHSNPSLESKQWIVKNKLPGLIGPDLEEKIMQAYEKSKVLLPNSMSSPSTVYAIFRMDNGEELKSVME